MTTLLLSDTALLLELACTLATLCYLVKLAFNTKQDEAEVSLPLPSTSRYCSYRYQYTNWQKPSWSDVGTLIPISKRSLNGQRI